MWNEIRIYFFFIFEFLLKRGGVLIFTYIALQASQTGKQVPIYEAFSHDFCRNTKTTQSQIALLHQVKQPDLKHPKFGPLFTDSTLGLSRGG